MGYRKHKEGAERKVENRLDEGRMREGRKKQHLEIFRKEKFFSLG